VVVICGSALDQKLFRVNDIEKLYSGFTHGFRRQLFCAEPADVSDDDFLFGLRFLGK